MRLRAQRARLRLGEGCSRGLDLGLGRGQALLELRRVLLNEALDLGDRRGIYSQAAGKVGDEAPVFEGDDAAFGRDELALVLDQADEPLLRPIDRGGKEILNLRRGERLLRHVRGELLRRRRDRSGERLGGGRQLLLDLGLDVDVGVELIDREDAELLLDVLVLEDLFGAIGELVGVEDLGLNPVRDHRDDQHHRREHDEGPHEGAVTMLRLSRRAILRALAPGGLSRGCRGSLGGRGGARAGRACSEASESKNPVGRASSFAGCRHLLQLRRLRVPVVPWPQGRPLRSPRRVTCARVSLVPSYTVLP